MGMRPFAGVQTLSGTAQPCFGTAVTAAFTPPPDPFSGNLNPGSNETQVSVTVTSTKGFLPGDKVAVGPSAAFEPGIVALGSGPDEGEVKSVTDGTHMIIQGLKKSHAATGEWVILSDVAGNVHIRPVTISSADEAYIGNASTVAAGDPSVLDVLPAVTGPTAAPGYVFDAESLGMTQPFNLTEFWIIGTASDTFIARYSTV